MGKKLTAVEIDQAIKDNPNVTFDICSVCEGSEIDRTMKSVDPDGSSFDLICNECNNHFTRKVMSDVKNKVDEMFVNAHQSLKTKSGDISPEQSQRLNKIQEDLVALIIEQTLQNK